MAIRKHNIIVLSICILIAAVIPFIYWNKKQQQHIESKTFRVPNGWGYDILVNGKLLIRQESVPVIAGNYAFTNRTEAQQTANIVIEKLKKGLNPSLTMKEIEKLCAKKKAGDEEHQ